LKSSQFSNKLRGIGGAKMKKAIFIVVLFLLSLMLISRGVSAQDPVKVDPNHYKVEFENDQVRVLRITYGPHEKSVMHDHPNTVAVFLTNGNVKFTLSDGKTKTEPAEAGQAIFAPAGKHLPENLSDKPLELILVELKTPANK
jgi:quercetin dioxygenase-like cupin family protein